MVNSDKNINDFKSLDEKSILLFNLYQCGIKADNMKSFFDLLFSFLKEYFHIDSICIFQKSEDTLEYETVFNNTNNECKNLNDELELISNNNSKEDSFQRSVEEFLQSEPCNNIKYKICKQFDNFNINTKLIILLFKENGLSSENESTILDLLDKIPSVINRLVINNNKGFKEKIQEILDFIYDFAIVFDLKGKILFSNQTAKEKLSINEEDEISIFQIIDDPIQIEKFSHNQYLKTKEIYTELISIFGKSYPTRILLTKITIDNVPIIFAIGKDINEEDYYRNVEIRSSADNLLFKITADFVLELLAKNDVTEALLKFLPNLSRLILSDRIFLAIKPRLEIENEYEVIVIWNRNNGKAVIGNENAIKHLSIPENSGYLPILLGGKPVQVNYSEADDEDKKVLNYYGFKSMFSVPIIMNKEFIGVFSVVDNEEERIVGTNEANALIIIANAIAAAYERKETFKELVKARHSAEEAYKTKANFLSCMSHEVRTPLNGIIGMAELLHMTNIDEEQLEFVDTIEHSANKLVDIVNDILDLSRIDSGNFFLESRIFNFRDLVKKTVYTLAGAAFKKNVEVIVDADDNIPFELLGDSFRYRQVLNNILTNAVKYTNEGEIIVKITQEWIKDKYVTIKTSIKDTGIGIDPEKIDTIFESFGKADYSTSNDNRGAGLGLAISKKLLELMGGSISCESELGKGSDFTFESKFGVLREELHNYSELYSIAPNLSILIIDDNKDSLEILESYLKIFVNNLSFAESYLQAEEIIKTRIDNNSPFDCIIIDSSMSDLSPVEFISDIRDIEKNNYQNIILLLTQELTDLEKIFIDENFVNCIHKPVFPEDLYNFLNENALSRNKPSLLMETHNTNIQKEPHIFTVLVAEDNIFNLKLTVTLLKKKNWRIITAEDGLEAVNQYKTNKIDLVLLDIQMPEMNGYEAAKIIREEQKLSNHPAPIIAITAYAMKGDREKALSSGMDEYIAKPVDPSKFYEILNHQIIKYKNITNPPYKFDELIKKYYNDPFALRSNLEKSVVHLKQFSIDINNFFNLRDFDSILVSINSIKESIALDNFRDLSVIIIKLKDTIPSNDLELISLKKDETVEEINRLITYYKEESARKFD